MDNFILIGIVIHHPMKKRGVLGYFQITVFEKDKGFLSVLEAIKRLVFLMIQIIHTHDLKLISVHLAYSINYFSSKDYMYTY